jgi:plastocyanin
MVHIKQAASVLALSASALAATINVAVSSVFTPNSITAAEGDIIQFDFESQHSVVRSEFSSPCVAASDNQIYSGTLSSVREPIVIPSRKECKD